MKALILILTLILSAQAQASRSCFNNEAVSELIAVSKAFDICFETDTNPCGFTKKTVEEQQSRNSKRLIPFDRTTDPLMNNAVGQVSVKFGEYNGPGSGQQYSASGQKISRCHIITSAHLLYADGKFPINSENFEIKFKTGQTCNVDQPFADEVGAKVAFKMTRLNTDYACSRVDQYNNCYRQFVGHSDLVILKLDKFESKDRNFFSLNTANPNTHKMGQKVNCWGFPGHNENIKLPAQQSNALLWAQKDAQIFGDDNGKFAMGVLTNAISYEGMSGGGCSTSQNPRELVGVFAKDNKSNGQAAIDIAPERAFTHGANYLSSFHNLAQRYKAETGKTLADLDKECN